MADNDILTNGKTQFDADTNPAIPVRSTEKATKKVQHVIIDWGGTGAESTTVPSFATTTKQDTIIGHIDGVETKLDTIITALGAPSVAILPVTATHTRPSMTDAASSTILAANASRKKALVQNNTAATIWIKEGVAGVINQGFPLYQNQTYTVVTTAAVNGWQTSGGAVNLDVLEAT